MFASHDASTSRWCPPATASASSRRRPREAAGARAFPLASRAPRTPSAARDRAGKAQHLGVMRLPGLSPIRAGSAEVPNHCPSARVARRAASRAAVRCSTARRCGRRSRRPQRTHPVGLMGWKAGLRPDQRSASGAVSARTSAACRPLRTAGPRWRGWLYPLGRRNEEPGPVPLRG